MMAVGGKNFTREVPSGSLVWTDPLFLGYLGVVSKEKSPVSEMNIPTVFLGWFF